MVPISTRAWIACGLLVAGFLVGWQAQSWRMSGQLAEQRAEHIDQLRRTAEANAQIILQQQANQRAMVQRLADLDTMHTKELSNALQENRRLENLYSAADGERRRLRIEVVVARNDAIVSEATGPGSMGDAASLELSPAARRAVFDLRRSLIEDREKLEYLQDFVRQIDGYDAARTHATDR